MFRTKMVVLAMFLLNVVSTRTIWGAELDQVRWYDDVNSAWQASVSQKRPLLVFVTRADCLPCAKMKVGTYQDRNVATAINSRFVALTIDAARPSPLLKDLAVRGYPATFVISSDAVILQRIDGYVSPEQMTARLAKVPIEEPDIPKIRTVSERTF